MPCLCLSSGLPRRAQANQRAALKDQSESSSDRSFSPVFVGISGLQKTEFLKIHRSLALGRNKKTETETEVDDRIYRIHQEKEPPMEVVYSEIRAEKRTKHLCLLNIFSSSCAKTDPQVSYTIHTSYLLRELNTHLRNASFHFHHEASDAPAAAAFWRAEPRHRASVPSAPRE